MKPLLFVNKDLKVETDPEKVIALVAFFEEQEDEVMDENDFGHLPLNQKLINIGFLYPIGYQRTLYESLELHRKWQKKNYPQYRSTLISVIFGRMAWRFDLEAFHECWTRSSDDEGYPGYRKHRKALWPYNVSALARLPNVYASLVMKKEDFLKLNPGVVLEDYELDA